MKTYLCFFFLFFFVPTQGYLQDRDLQEEVPEVVVGPSPVHEVEEVTLSPDMLRAFEKLNDLTSVVCEATPIDQSKSTKPDFCADEKFVSIGEDSEIKHDYRTKSNVYAFRKDESKENPIHSTSIEIKQAGAGFSEMSKGEVISNETIYPSKSISQRFFGTAKEHIFEVMHQPVIEITKDKKVIDRFLYPNDLKIFQYTFFPRNIIPSVQLEKNGKDLTSFLTTGESFVTDLESGTMKSGVLSEVPGVKDVIKGNKKLIYPSTRLEYRGDGIFIETELTIRLDQRGPGNKVPVKAYVDGKLQQCLLSSSDIWIKEEGTLPALNSSKMNRWSCTRFKFETDNQFYDLIIKKCPMFKFPKLISYQPTSPSKDEKTLINKKSKK